MANTDDQNIKITFDTNAGQVAKQTNALGASLGGVEDAAKDTAKAVHGLDATFDEVYEGMKPLTARMGEAEDRLYELALAGKQATQEYRDLLGVVSEYRRTQIETDRVVDAASVNLGGKFAGAAQVAATGIQGVTAGMALFGDQSESTEKALLQVQAAMAFADSIGQVAELGGQFRMLKDTVMASSLAQKANAAATGLAAIATTAFGGTVNATSGGFKALKIAIAGTGIGLLVVGLVALVANFDKVKKVALAIVPGLALVGDQIMGIVNAITDFIGVTSEAERKIEKSKSLAEKSLAQNEKYLKRHENTLTDAQKREIELRNEHFQRVKDGEFSQAESLKIFNEAKAKDAMEAQAKVDEENEKAAEKRRAKEKERLEKEKAAAEKAEAERIRLALEAQQKREDLLKEQEAEQKRAKDELIDTSYEEAEQKKLDHELWMAETAAKQRELDFEDQKAKDSAALAQKEANQQALVTGGEQLIKNVAMLAGKNKAIQKAAIIADGAVSIGKAGVNTAEAVTKDLAKGAPLALPLIAMDVAVGASSIAAIIMNTNKALQAVGGGSAPSAGASVRTPGVAPTVAFNNTAENQIGASVAKTQSDQPPLKVFVSESDITTAQNNVQALVNKNTI